MWADSNYHKEFGLRKGLTDLLKKVPEWFILLRGDKRFPCLTCYSEVAGEGDSDCPACFGLGNKVDPIVIPGRLVHALGPRDAEMVIEAGDLANRVEVLHTVRETHADRGDLILRVSWNVESYKIPSSPHRTPVQLLDVYDIVERERPYEGEVVWSKLLVKKAEFYSNTIVKSFSRFVGITILLP